MICFATCMFGVEALVRDELIMLGAKMYAHKMPAFSLKRTER